MTSKSGNGAVPVFESRILCTIFGAAMSRASSAWFPPPISARISRGGVIGILQVAGIRAGDLR